MSKSESELHSSLAKIKLAQENDSALLDMVQTSADKDPNRIGFCGFPYELTEGDLICVFSQYGEIVNINLVRDKKTGKSKGFCFICYEDQRSTILAVDNFNGIKIKGRTIRVDHVKNYRPPKDHEDIDDITKRLREDGCAPTEPAAAAPSEEDEQQDIPKKEKKKKKKEKKEKKKKKSRESSSSTDSSPRPPAAIRVKEEKQDAAYDKYNHQGVPERGRDREDTDREIDRREDRDNRDRRRDDRETERKARDVRDREADRRRDDGRREDRREEDREDRWRDREDSRRRDRDTRRRETERR
uniref:RRM domain-containing protein n=1 Tax=Poecilia mexicana TaxID=48701 RepID=A0A3B3Z299_9TELE